MEFRLKLNILVNGLLTVICSGYISLGQATETRDVGLKRPADRYHESAFMLDVPKESIVTGYVFLDAQCSPAFAVHTQHYPWTKEFDLGFPFNGDKESSVRAYVLHPDYVDLSKLHLGAKYEAALYPIKGYLQKAVAVIVRRTMTQDNVLPSPETLLEIKIEECKKALSKRGAENKEVSKIDTPSKVIDTPSKVINTPSKVMDLRQKFEQGNPGSFQKDKMPVFPRGIKRDVDKPSMNPVPVPSHNPSPSMENGPEMKKTMERDVTPLAGPSLRPLPVIPQEKPKEIEKPVVNTVQIPSVVPSHRPLPVIPKVTEK